MVYKYKTIIKNNINDIISANTAFSGLSALSLFSVFSGLYEIPDFRFLKRAL